MSRSGKPRLALLLLRFRPASKTSGNVLVRMSGPAADILSLCQAPPAFQQAGEEALIAVDGGGGLGVGAHFVVALPIFACHAHRLGQLGSATKQIVFGRPEAVSRS